ncbi:type II toxin-antitoxin system HicB family antitoxin [Companilactobacillus hulinensis]|uniref:type II toxin-antitoxin system HicB family antitoxin n=1 Tax=Companilactobacillus hulinensis TaxID=2486007 RepID=UPI000F78D147|nr:type II toxin-antitoxin system HicB family antitoxin [Companilactobacillus hulinensis]
MENKRNILIYPVILHPEDKGYTVEIPDVDGGTWTQGEDLRDALLMAEDAVGIMLEDMTEYPKATDLENINCSKNDIKTIISIDMDEYRRNNPKTVRKNVTVPEYLVKLGKEQNINFSATLTEALRTKLDV